MEGTENQALDVNFYSLPCKPNKAFVIDPIAGDAIMDINCSMYGEKKFMTRKTSITSSSVITTDGCPTSLPLSGITTAYDPGETFVHSSLTFCAKEYLNVNVTKLMKYLQRKHSDILFESVMQTIKDEPWRSVVKKKLKHGFDGSAFRTRKNYSIFKVTRFDAMYDKPSHISRYFRDIPTNVLTNIINESCFQEHDNLVENSNLRNCLVVLHHLGHVFVVCAREYEVVVLRLLLDVDDVILSCEECEKVDMTFKVNELLLYENEAMIIARSNYTCTFLQTKFENDVLHLEKHEIRFDKLLHAVSKDATCTNGVLVVASDSSISLLQDGCLKRNIKRTGIDDSSLKWQNIIHGNFSQTCLVSNEQEVLLYDFREQQAKTKTYLQLPTEYLNRYELFSPVLFWNPLNIHQYFTTTNQTVLLNDERYLKTPVMAVNHYMDSPPRLSQTLTSSAANDQGMLLILGNYYHKEIVGMNFKLDNTVEQLSFTDDLQIPFRKPLQLDGPLFKFSSHDEWITGINDWRKSYKKVSTRIHSPLAGMGVCSEANNGQILFQASLAGDVFYQKFRSAKSSNNNNDEVRKLCELNQAQKHRCISWMSDCFDVQYGCSTHDNNRNVKSQSETETKKKNDNDDRLLVKSSRFRNDIKITENCCSSSPEVKNSPDREIPAENLEASSKAKQSCSTPELWKTFEKLKKQNRTMTRASLNSPELTKELNIFSGHSDELQVKPLSKVLLANWNSEDYISLAKFAPDISLTSD